MSIETWFKFCFLLCHHSQKHLKALVHGTQFKFLNLDSKPSISQQLWCSAKTTISALQFPSYLTLDKLLHFPESVCSSVRITVPSAHGTLGYERRIFLVGSGWQLLLNNFIPSSICSHLYHLPLLPFGLCSAVQIFPFGQTQSPSLLQALPPFKASSLKPFPTTPARADLSLLLDSRWLSWHLSSLW